MAEALLNSIGGDEFYAESAGFEPVEINPLIIESMKETGIDISKNKTKSVFDFFKESRLFHFVITLTGGANAERCPVFPGVTKRIVWTVDDPAAITGSYEEKLAKMNSVRDEIKSKVEHFIKTHHQVKF